MSDQYLIRFDGFWYRPDANGYTDSVFVAGRFSMGEALKHRERDGTQIVLDDPKNLRVYMAEGERIAQDRIVALEARCAGRERERDALKAELEQERVRLAGCGVAAMGYEDKEPLEPGSYGYSASYDDVLRFRKQLISERDALQAKLAAATAIITRLRSKLHDKCEELSYHALACARCNMADQLRGSLGSQIEHERRKLATAAAALRDLTLVRDEESQFGKTPVSRDLWKRAWRNADAILAGHAPAPATSQQAAPSEREKRLEKALRFYADRKSYDGHYMMNPLVINDQGKCARAALADTTNTGG